MIMSYSLPSPLPCGCRRASAILYLKIIFFLKNAKKVIFPNLKPSTKTISLRLPEIMLAELKMLANKKDVPYQSLLKMYIAEMLKKDISTYRGKI